MKVFLKLGFIFDPKEAWVHSLVSVKPAAAVAEVVIGSKILLKVGI